MTMYGTAEVPNEVPIGCCILSLTFSLSGNLVEINIGVSID
jgi:hypothetical protein